MKQAASLALCVPGFLLAVVSPAPTSADDFWKPIDPAELALKVSGRSVGAS